MAILCAQPLIVIIGCAISGEGLVQKFPIEPLMFADRCF